MCDGLAYCSACGCHANEGLIFATTKALPTLNLLNTLATSHGITFYAPLINTRVAAHLYAMTQSNRDLCQSGSTPRTHVPGFEPSEWDGSDVGEQRDQT